LPKYIVAFSNAFVGICELSARESRNFCAVVFSLFLLSNQQRFGQKNADFAVKKKDEKKDSKSFLINGIIIKSIKECYQTLFLVIMGSRFG
jgi:hypothetical protein